MLLIADSGSTKTDWCVSSEGIIYQRINTQGINPFHQSWDDIHDVIVNELLPRLGDTEITKIVFYGSGFRNEKIQLMTELVSLLFPHSEIEINGDLLAAARAVCNRTFGIACILGTGANSCLYDGNRVIMNTPPLGYILGDEGSGAVMGKMFVNALYKGFLPSQLKDELYEEKSLLLSDIIEKVYCEPMANRFLATLVPFIHKHCNIEDVNRLVVDNFRSFFTRNLSQYGRSDLPVGAIGSVAYYFKRQLAAAAEMEGYRLGTVSRSPMEGLVKFHNNE